MFLNCTKRTAAEPIVERFFESYPTPESYIIAYILDDLSGEIKEMIAPLGFRNRRAETIFRFSLDFLGGKSIKECFGIGDYADASDRMYFEMDFDDEPPRDGALVKVWRWVVEEGGRKFDG
jgi:hypothetical protein